MKQKEFSDWNGHLSDKYKLDKKDTEDNIFKLTETTWMNFGWGESRDPSTGKIVMVPHPDEVWFRKTFNTSEPWQRVKISRSEVDSHHPPPLYDSPVPINPYKIKDLNNTFRNLSAPSTRPWCQRKKTRKTVQRMTDSNRLPPWNTKTALLGATAPK